MYLSDHRLSLRSLLTSQAGWWTSKSSNQLNLTATTYNTISIQTEDFSRNVDVVLGSNYVEIIHSGDYLVAAAWRHFYFASDGIRIAFFIDDVIEPNGYNLQQGKSGSGDRGAGHCRPLTLSEGEQVKLKVYPTADSNNDVYASGVTNVGPDFVFMGYYLGRNVI